MIEVTLTLHGDCEIVGEAATGAATLAECQSHPADILIIDPASLDLGGAPFVRRLRAAHGGLRIFVFCGATSLWHVVEILEAGTDAFAHKKEEIATFHHALQASIGGARFYSPYAEMAARSQGGRNGGREKLGRRELQVLTLLTQSRSNKEIAQALGIAARTVDHYRSDLMEKLDIHDIAGLTRYALGMGLIGLEERGHLTVR